LLLTDFAHPINILRSGGNFIEYRTVWRKMATQVTAQLSLPAILT